MFYWHKHIVTCSILQLQLLLSIWTIWCVTSSIWRPVVSCSRADGSNDPVSLLPPRSHGSFNYLTPQLIDCKNPIVMPLLTLRNPWRSGLLGGGSARRGQGQNIGLTAGMKQSNFLPCLHHKSPIWWAFTTWPRLGWRTWEMTMNL